MIFSYKENLQRKAREQYRNLPEEEKNRKRQYALEKYRNLFEEERNKRHQYGRV